MVYSSPPSNLSFKDSKSGSWFIQTFCDTLGNSESEGKDLVTNLTHVCSKVSNAYARLAPKTPKGEVILKREIPCITSMLTKSLHMSIET